MDSLDRSMTACPVCGTELVREVANLTHASETMHLDERGDYVGRVVTAVAEGITRLSGGD